MRAAVVLFPGLNADAEMIRTLELAGAERRPRVVSVSATTGQGLDELVSALDEHRTWLGGEAGQAELERREQAEIARRIAAEVMAQLLEPLAGELRVMAERVRAAELDPYAAADLLSRRIAGSSSPDNER